MSEPSVEEIVSQIEAHIALDDDGWQMDNEEFEALIASWRERGEALKPFATIGSGFDMNDVMRARAALKAAGEK